MIQRIQTVWYFLAILSLLSVFVWFPISHELIEAPTEALTFKVERDTWLLVSWMLNLLIATLLLVVIFMFKNLRLQQRLGRMAITLYLLVILGWIAYYFFVTPGTLGTPVLKIKHVLSFGFYCSAVGIIFNYLGNRGVSKDRKLLDSLNRLR